MKFVGLLSGYGLVAAASHLLNWISGTLPMAPLLDVSALLSMSCEQFGNV